MPPKKLPAPARKRAGENICLWLTEHLSHYLERCRLLIGQYQPQEKLLNRSEIVRLAVRRLLLAILGDRANLADPADPALCEYLAVLDDGDPLSDVQGVLGEGLPPRPKRPAKRPTKATQKERGE